MKTSWVQSQDSVDRDQYESETDLQLGENQEPQDDMAAVSQGGRDPAEEQASRWAKGDPTAYGLFQVRLVSEVKGGVPFFDS